MMMNSAASIKSLLLSQGRRCATRSIRLPIQQPEARLLSSQSNQKRAHQSALYRFRRQAPAMPVEDSGLRPNTVMLFPGDYTDDADSIWDDDLDHIEEEDDPEGDAILREIVRRDDEEQARRARWIENNQPPVWTSEIDERGRAYGRGGRKRAAARVWIQPGFGEIVVNRQSFVDYFRRLSNREHVMEPLVATETCGAFDVQVTVQGGGLTGQAGAVRHGLARALSSYNPDLYRAPLKKLGLLTRDARRVERKKVGRKKARKSPQWVRR